MAVSTGGARGGPGAVTARPGLERTLSPQPVAAWAPSRTAGARRSIDRSRAEPLGGLDGLLGFRIRLAQVTVARDFMARLAGLDLTQMQAAVLWLVNDNPGLAQVDIGRLMRMDRATTLGVVSRLEARGLLRRGPCSRDGRRNTLGLTAEGDSLLALARQAIAEHEKGLKDRFSRRELRKLFDLLTRIHR